MIKNYTSGVPVEKTISRIEAMLAKAGVDGISKSYSSGSLVALQFQVYLVNKGVPVTIRLPANHEAVYNSLRKQIKRPRNGTMDKLKEQAIRTSWKLMQDWVEVQLSLIEMQQVDFMQVFLPYVWDGKQTFYDALLENNFKSLPEWKGGK